MVSDKISLSVYVLTLINNDDFCVLKITKTTNFIMGVPRHFSRGRTKFFLSEYIDLFLKAYFSLEILLIAMEITIFQGEGASAPSCHPPWGHP